MTTTTEDMEHYAHVAGKTPRGDRRAAVLAADDLPHPNEDDRYAIYSVTKRLGRRPARVRVAETHSHHVVSTIETLLDEDQIPRGARVGVLDRATRRWVVNPWA